MVQAIFFDLDGTLISHNLHDIPQNTLDTLYTLKEKGIKLFVCTGRHTSEFSYLPLHDFPFDGYVALTGHLCTDQDMNILFEDPLHPEDKEILLQTFQKKEHPIALINDHQQYINYVNEYVKKAQADVSSPVPESHDYQGEELYAAMVYGDKKTAQSFIEKLPHCSLSMWNPLASDIIPNSGGKSKGMEMILKHYNIPKENTMAFGDGDNDIDMLDYAHIGIAMDNGTPSVKEVADYITTSVDQDGITQALKHYKVL